VKILSHRGYWKLPSEKNTIESFTRSFRLGFGTETDVRDLKGELVISHDMPLGGELSFESMLEMAVALGVGAPLTLALNVKSDGLATKINEILLSFPSLDCFVFDMAVPDMAAYLDTEVDVFSRMSEVEVSPTWLNRCDGVWLDSFYGDWFGTETVEDLINLGKRVCVVSSELHRRDSSQLWEKIKSLANEDHLMLCTDTPEEAFRFFNE